MGLKFKSKKLSSTLDYIVSHSKFSNRKELITWLESVILLDSSLKISSLDTVALCKGDIPIAIWG